MNISNHSGFSNVRNNTDYNDVFQSDVYIFVIYGVIVPVIVAFGYMGNILTAIILWKKVMVSTNNILLRALVLTDTALITEMLLFLSLPTLISTLLDYDLGINVIRNQGFTAFNYIMMTSQQSNEYVLVFISVERYIAVCHPLKCANYKSRGRTIALLCGIICCSVVYNIPRFLASTVHPTACINVNSSFTCYEIVYTEFGDSYFYREVYLVWMYGATYFVLPLVVLLIMNIFIIKELAKMRNVRRNLGVVNSSSAQNDSISQSLVIIMAVFGVVQTLGFFNQFWNFGEIETPLFTAIVNTLYGINSSINILIYVAVGKKFRRNVSVLFKTCFCCFKLVTNPSEHYQVTTTSSISI